VNLSQFRLINLAMDKASSPELKAIKEQFAAFDLCADKRTAAAFGYLLAKEEACNSEPEQEELGVYDEVIAILELHAEDLIDSERAADKVFGAIYQWLAKVPGLDREVLECAFLQYLPPTDG
jgi:hypothetical protein